MQHPPDFNELNKGKMIEAHAKYLSLPVSIVLTFYLVASVPVQQKTVWEAPKEADAFKNPLRDDTDATLAGQKLYETMCTICHGNKGKGDGTAGVNLNPRPTNLTTSKVQQQTDGAIYWKITEGRSPMASYKSTLNENQRWQLVNYVRQLAK